MADAGIHLNIRPLGSNKETNLQVVTCILKPVFYGGKHLVTNMPYWFDGNNLIGQSAATARADSQTRRAFLSTLSSYKKSGGGRFLVYFDGEDPDRSSSPTGISIRYSAPESTDTAILHRLHEIQNPSEVIVVTNDRELATRCRNSGASTLSWQQFTLKMQSRPPAKPRKQDDSQQKVDVEDWLRYFGLDDS
jgi:predicted RNA-binding protein with PIN domain